MMYLFLNLNDGFLIWYNLGKVLTTEWCFPQEHRQSYPVSNCLLLVAKNCLLLVKMRVKHISRPLHYLLRFLLKLSTTQTRINFTYPCCFTKKTHMVKCLSIILINFFFKVYFFQELFHPYQISWGEHTETAHEQRTSSLEKRNYDASNMSHSN